MNQRLALFVAMGAMAAGCAGPAEDGGGDVAPIGSAREAVVAASSLTTTIAGPTSAAVNAVSHYDVIVVNNGAGPTAASWSVAIQLPVTNGTYGQLALPVLLGTLGAVSPGCALASDLRLVCTRTTPLGSQPGANTTTIGFDLTLPYITKPFAITAVASAANDDGLGAPSATIAPAQTFHTVNAPLGQATLDYCGGAGRDGTGRRSFFECVVAPGYTLTYKMTLAPGGALTNFVMNGKLVPSRGGSWAINGTRLDVVLTVNGAPIGTMSLQGVSPRCWEGPLATANGVPVTAPAQYRICL